FSKVIDKKRYDLLRRKNEEKMIQFFESIGKKPIFMMSKDGYPADQEIKLATSSASILFHFRRNEEETRYFPTIKYENQRLEFMFKNAVVLTNVQAWLLLNNTLYYFDQPLEGKKLSPFLNKRYISVGRSTEKKYFETFVCGLIERYHVYAEGFDIRTHQHDAVPLLRLIYIEHGASQLQLQFQYGPHIFTA